MKATPLKESALRNAVDQGATFFFSIPKQPSVVEMKQP